MDIKEVRIKRIKDRMNEIGISSRELAKRSGISESGISRILSGEIEPRLKTFIKIADALRIDYEYLMGVENTHTPDLSIETEKIALLVECMTPEEQKQVESYVKFIIESRGGNQA